MRFKSSFTTPAVAAISFCLIGGTSTTPAYADLGDQLAKLLPRDGAGTRSGYFGYSVGISGDTAIVGAQGDDLGECPGGCGEWPPAYGSAYLFDTTTGRQLAKLLPNDGGAWDRFGSSVAIGGPRGKEVAIVGAVTASAAYLFNITTGEQIAKFQGDGAVTSQFGRSVAISPTTAIVGAALESINNTRTGAAYLFDTTTGERIAKLLADDGTAYVYFGASVAIRGATAIVGAPQDDYYTGSAYLFDTTTGKQLTKLLAHDGAEEDQFGYSVAFSRTVVLVGAPADSNGNGAAYLFDISDPANPVQIFKLLADDGAAGDYFGSSVAISGTTAIVGANLDDDNGSGSGSAYLFDISDPTNPVQIAKLLAKDGASHDEFGSVAIGGPPENKVAIVGAYNDFTNGVGGVSGSAYLFDAAAPGTCPWDLDDDAVVGVPDLLSLLGSWGPCPPKGDCPADFDNSGDVGVSDFLELLGNWGLCP